MSFRLKTDRYGRITVSLATGRTAEKTKKAKPLSLFVVFHEANVDGRTLHSGFYSVWESKKKGEPHGQGRATKTEIDRKSGKSDKVWTRAKIEAIAEELKRIPKSHPITILTDDERLLGIKYDRGSKMAQIFDEAVGNRSVSIQGVRAESTEMQTARALIDRAINKRANNDNEGARMRENSSDRFRSLKIA